jgi:hypothetical protein
MNNLKPKAYNDLREEAARIYDTQDSIRDVATKLGINTGAINLQGPARFMWDSFLSYAESQSRIRDLVALMSESYPASDIFKKTLASIDDKSAFIEKIDINHYLSPSNELAKNTFIIYDLRDTTIVKALKAQLFPLTLIGEIKIVDMHVDSEGLEREKRYLELLGKADIVLLILTSSFFDQDNSCLKLAFTAFEMRKTVIPVLIQNTMWARIKLLGGIVPLPVDGKPVSEWRNKDEALYEIAKGVSRVANRIQNIT